MPIMAFLAIIGSSINQNANQNTNAMTLLWRVKIKSTNIRKMIICQKCDNN